MMPNPLDFALNNAGGQLQGASGSSSSGDKSFKTGGATFGAVNIGGANGGIDPKFIYIGAALVGLYLLVNRKGR